MKKMTTVVVSTILLTSSFNLVQPPMNAQAATTLTPATNGKLTAKQAVQVAQRLVNEERGRVQQFQQKLTDLQRANQNAQVVVRQADQIISTAPQRLVKAKAAVKTSEQQFEHAKQTQPSRTELNEARTELEQQRAQLTTIQAIANGTQAATPAEKQAAITDLPVVKRSFADSKAQFNAYQQKLDRLNNLKVTVATAQDQLTQVSKTFATAQQTKAAQLAIIDTNAVTIQ